MATSITQKIEVSAQAKFENDHSQPNKREFLFSYHISIRNNNNYAVQLLRRHWYIFDSVSEYSEVKGEGVIGEQPIILPGQVHEYDSFCNLQSEIGLMWGTYLMKRVEDNELFEVKIPEFELIANFKLN